MAHHALVSTGSSGRDPVGEAHDMAAFVRHTDLSAFEDLYDSNVEGIMRFFYRRTACPHTAADLTSETFAVALASLRSYRPDRGPVEAWLFGIARNLLRRYERWRSIDSRARRRLGLQAKAVLDSESEAAIEQLVDLQAISGLLADAIDRLSPKLAMALELRVMGGLSFPDVARRLGCTESAARARVSRALRRLETELEGKL
ncbi:MAG: sigma-70 family RNA polymerase sigma factor [Acidimicrobiia bacterium]|nr:sigma-70 family RNA polymerase sigma factor [Acidimicrobiia bacterium]